MRENDTLLFSSIQFQNVSVAVTTSVLEKGRLDISLVEDVNELSEVNISNINLSGNLNTDIANIQIVREMPVNVKFAVVKDITFEADAEDPHGATPTTLAFQQNQKGATGGVNILGAANMISDLLGGSKRQKAVIPGPAIPNKIQLRKLFEDEFSNPALTSRKNTLLIL